MEQMPDAQHGAAVDDELGAGDGGDDSLRIVLVRVFTAWLLFFRDGSNDQLASAALRQRSFSLRGVKPTKRLKGVCEPTCLALRRGCFLQTFYGVLDVAQLPPRFFDYCVCPAYEYANRQRRSRGNNLLDPCAPAPAEIDRTRVTNDEGICL